VNVSDIPVKILFLAAEPSNEARLRLGQELRDIRERLQLSKERDRFILERVYKFGKKPNLSC
jgi:hypothetical protein